MNRIHENGSVLIFIFIGVMLFGALSYVVAGMMRGGDENYIGEQKASLLADEIMDYGRQLRQAVISIKISNGCEDTDISLANNVVPGYEHSPVASDDCKVFNSAGGSMAYVAPTTEILDSAYSGDSLYGEWYFSGDICAESIGTKDTNCHGDGIDNSELIAYLPFIKKNICLAINDKAGVENPSGDAPYDNNTFWGASRTKFTGAYSENNVRIDGPFSVLSTEHVMCVKSNGGSHPPVNSYTYVHILIPR